MSKSSCSTWARRLAPLPGVLVVELRSLSGQVHGQCLRWQLLLWRNREVRIFHSCPLGAALKLRPYHWSPLVLHRGCVTAATPAHGLVPLPFWLWPTGLSCLQTCRITVALRGDHQTVSESDHCLWTWSSHRFAIPHPGSLLVRRLLPPFYCAWLTEEAASPRWSLAHPTRFWLCLHLLFLSGPHSRTSVISPPSIKANSITIYIFFQNATQPILYVYSAIFHRTG